MAPKFTELNSVSLENIVNVKLQVIEPSQFAPRDKSGFQRSFLSGSVLLLGGVIVFLLPITGLLPADMIRSNLIFWSLILVSLVLLGIGSCWVWLAWLYNDEEQIQGRVIAILGGILDDDYKYLCNLNSLANRAGATSKNPWWHIGSGDAGGVLLGPHGAWVLQICRYSGVYACEGDTWYKYSPSQTKRAVTESDTLLAKRRLDDSPNWQVIRAAREVKAWLSVRDLPQVTVQPIVILAHGKIRFSKRPSCPIVELWYLETYLKKMLVTVSALIAETPPVSEEVVSQIVARLT